MLPRIYFRWGRAAMARNGVFWEHLLWSIKNVPLRIFWAPWHFFNDVAEAVDSLRRKQPIRFGVLPEWLRSILNIYRIK